jgi:hypothetical protein
MSLRPLFMYVAAEGMERGLGSVGKGKAGSVLASAWTFPLKESPRPTAESLRMPGCAVDCWKSHSLKRNVNG